MIFLREDDIYLLPKEIKEPRSGDSVEAGFRIHSL